MSVRECDSQDQAGMEALGNVVRGAFEPMPADARARVRARLDEAMAAERVPFFARFARPLIALAVGATMLGGVSVAAAASDPGDLFYPVKRSAAAVATTFDRPAAQRTLKPIDTPAKTPAAAVQQGTRVSPSATPANASSASKKTGTTQKPPAAASSKPGKKTSSGKGKGSSGKGKSTSSRSHSVRPVTQGNGRPR